jgi:3-oxoacyl-(acyl-carrier-protein) synthase
LPEVAITGLGPVAPNGVGRCAYWEALANGKSGIRRISINGHSDYIVGQVPDQWVKSAETTTPDPHISRCARLILLAATMALNDAGIGREEFSTSRSGIKIGVSTIDMEAGEVEYESFKNSGTIRSSVLAATIPHAAASQMARELQCYGEVLTFSVACSSGLVSIISAAESILAGEADVVLAGGGDAPLTPFLISCFRAAGLYPDNLSCEPSDACRPFDARREGGILSEGAGVVVLENVERARRRGARIYATISGWGIANATSSLSLRTSFASAMASTLHNASLQPCGVDYICAHAPGDRIVDRSEIRAIKEAFGDFAYNLPVSSIKSMIGNPLAAAGALQVIAAVQAIQAKFIPPTINYREPDPQCDLDCVPNKGRVARVDSVLINSAGIGGCTASLAISRP